MFYCFPCSFAPSFLPVLFPPCVCPVFLAAFGSSWRPWSSQTTFVVVVLAPHGVLLCLLLARSLALGLCSANKWGIFYLKSWSPSASSGSGDNHRDIMVATGNHDAVWLAPETPGRPVYPRPSFILLPGHFATAKYLIHFSPGSGPVNMPFLIIL